MAESRKLNGWSGWVVASILLIGIIAGGGRLIANVHENTVNIKRLDEVTLKLQVDTAVIKATTSRTEQDVKELLQRGP